MQGEEERHLLESFIDGDNNAFSAIYTKYVDELFAYGMGLRIEEAELKDAIQEVFFKLYENRKKLSHVRNIKYYLFRMLKNHLINIRNSTPFTYDISSPGYEFSIKTTVLDDMIRKKDRELIEETVDNLMKTLTSRQKEAVYLRFIQELSYDEVGSLLDMTPQASRKLVFRAIKRMRETNLNILLILCFFNACR